MTRDEAVDLLKLRLVRSGDTTLDTRIVSEMQFVQETLLEGGVTLPWFLLSENMTTTTTVDEERLTLPSTFLREHEECALWVYDTTNSRYEPLLKDDYDAILERWPTETGLPKRYSIDGAYFRLKPTPDAAYTVRMKVYLKDAELVSGTVENNWLKYAPDLVIAETGAIIAGNYLRDAAMMQRFEADAAKARRRLFIVDEARKHANRDYAMGDD